MKKYKEKYTLEKFPGLRNIRQTIEKVPELWIILSSTTLALLSALSLYQFSGTELTHFSDRTIGVCAAAGVDPNLRTTIFFKIVFLIIFSFIISFILLCLFNRFLEKKGLSFRISVEKSAISIFSGVGLVNFILYIITLNPAFKLAFFFLLFLMVFVSCLTAGRILVEKHMGSRKKMRVNYSLFAAGLIIPYQFILGYAAFFEKKLTFGLKFFFIYIFTWVIIQLFIKAIRKVSKTLCKKGRPGIDKSIIRAAIPLILVPAVVPLSNEIQYSLVRYFYISPQHLALSSILICVVAAGVLFICFLRKSTFHFQERKLISNIYFPVIIAVDVFFATHNHFIDLARIDLFHLAEGILPIQQLVEFNRIPFIDYQLPHGLFDMFPQLFFYLLNKNATLDMFIWGNGFMMGWFSNIIAYLLFYALLKELTCPLFSLVAIIFIPMGRIFEPFYTPIIIPVLVLLFALKTYSFYRMALFWASVLFLILWRVDFGIAILGASFMVLAGITFTESKFNYKRAIASFIAVFASASGLFVLVVLLKERPLLELVSQLYAYIAIQVPSQSYEKVIKEYNPVVILQYVLLPAISVTYILFYFFRVFILRKALESSRHILAFFAVISIVLAMRSLHRHSLYEGIFATYLYVFLLIFLPFYLYRISKRKTMLVFLTLALVAHFVVPPLFPKFFYDISVKEGYPVFALDKKVFSYNMWRKGNPRVIITDPRYQKIQNAADFLDRHLEMDQTFFDLSNSPLLYFFTNRRHPAFIFEGVYYTSDSVQKILVKNLKTDIKNNELPFVVFKQSSLWDLMDMIPNEIRSYRIAEFIYNNYTPILKLENYEIWASKTFDTSNLIKQAVKENALSGSSGPKMKTIDSDTYSQGFSLRMLPYIWGTFDEHGPAHSLKSLFTFNENIPCKITRDRPFTADIDAEVDKSKGNYLHLSIDTKRPARVRISYGETSKNFIDFDLKPTGRTEDYLIRVSSQWAWVYQPVSSLIITTSAPIILQGARILEGD